MGWKTLTKCKAFAGRFPWFKSAMAAWSLRTGVNAQSMSEVFDWSPEFCQNVIDNFSIMPSAWESGKSVDAAKFADGTTIAKGEPMYLIFADDTEIFVKRIAEVLVTDITSGPAQGEFTIVGKVPNTGPTVPLTSWQPQAVWETWKFKITTRPPAYAELVVGDIMP